MRINSVLVTGDRTILRLPPVVAHASGVGEAEEIPAQAVRRTGRDVGIEEETAELLPGPQDFLALVAMPAGVGRREVEQFERPRQGTLEAARAPGFVRPDGASTSLRFPSCSIRSSLAHPPSAACLWRGCPISRAPGR